MDRIWEESQLDSMRQGADNKTNFSSVSVAAQAEMGSTEVRAASNEQLLSLSLRGERRKRCIPKHRQQLAHLPPPSLPLSSRKCRSMYKLRAGPVPMSLSLHF